MWFLWPSDGRQFAIGKCGCVGGCAFFGRNQNGQRFFKPSRSDIQDGFNIAAFRFIKYLTPDYFVFILFYK